MTDFTEYLHTHGLAPDEVALCFHKPVERAFAHFLPQLLVDYPELLEAYQSTHSDRASTLLSRHKHIASFVGHPDGWSVFAGLFRVAGSRQRSVAEIAEVPEIQTLYEEFGACAEFFDGVVQSWRWFDLVREPVMADLVGRLRVARQGPDQSYMQCASGSAVTVLGVAESVTLELPDWRQLSLVAREVQTMPAHWVDGMAGWHGIYVVTDAQDGARYVGASGAGGVVPSWREIVAGRGPGALAGRDPMSLRFAILERFDAGLDGAAVEALRASWILRLSTAQCGLNGK